MAGLVASSLAGIGKAVARWAVLGVVIVAASVKLALYYIGPREIELWPQNVATIAGDQAVPATIVTAPNSPGVALDYYLKQSGLRADVLPLPGPFATLSADGGATRPAGPVFRRSPPKA